MPVYREYGAQFWRGVKMSDVLLYWGGDERGNDYAESRKHDFAWCVPIGTQALHAAGAAMAFKIRGEKRCALAFIGDGGTSEGAFYEAINLAGARSLPVVFVIVNNKWAISVPISSQTAAATLAQKGNRRWHSRRAGRWQRRDRRAPHREPGARDRAQRRRPDADRGDHLSPERSHHRGRCEPLSAGGRSQERLEGRAADPAAQVPHRHRRLERSAGNALKAECSQAASKRRSRSTCRYAEAID